MRRLFAFVVFALLAAFPLLAQHGGGHASAGGHGGAGGHASFGGHAGGGGGHSFSGGGMRSGGSSRIGGIQSGRPSHTPLSSGNFNRGNLNRQNFNRQRVNRSRGPRNRNFGSCFGCRRFALGYGGYYDPYWWWDSGSSYDEDREREIAQANEMNAQSLDEQRYRQQDQNQDQNQDQDLYARSGQPAQPRQEQASPEPLVPPTVLVFRDQRHQEVQNYAIVGTTLWAFAPQRTQKIPLTDLDIPATRKANDDRGVDFKLPTGEGQ